MTDDRDGRIEALYAGPPAMFTKARDALVKDLRAEGLRSEADAVRALRRPSRLAAELNRLAREDPVRLDALIAAEELLAAVQRRMVEGSADASALREAERAEAEAVGAFPGGPPVHAALRFAARSPARADDLRRGRLVEDPAPDDQGGPFAFGPARPSPVPDRAPAPPAPVNEIADARARRAARSAGDAARREREAAQAIALQAATEALDAARAAESTAAAGRDAARRGAEAAEADVARLDAERDRLRGELAAVTRDLTARTREARAARAALDAADAALRSALEARRGAEEAARRLLDEAPAD